MTPKENLLAALRHQEPEWIPWIPLIDSEINIPCFVPSELRTVEPAPLRCLKIGEYLAERFGADILVRNGGLIETHFTSVKIIGNKVGNVIHTRYETEAGILTSAVEITPYGRSSLMTSRIIEHMFKGPQDFKPLQCYFQDMTYTLNAKRFQDLKAQAGERALICASAPTTPIMSLIMTYMGVEKFVYMLADYPGETEKTMEVMSDKWLECHRLIANSSAEAIMLGDDANTLLLSPRLYEQYGLPFLQKCTAISHKAGKVFIYHSCGNVKDLLGLIRQSGIDAHDYLTPPPVGDTPFKTAKRIWDDKITIMGAIDPVLLEMARPQAVEKYLLKVLKDMSPGKCFILETSSKPNVPEQNIAVIAKVMNKFGRYPLKMRSGL